MRPAQRSAWVRTGWTLVGLVGFAYLASSTVVVLNSLGNATGAVWLPSFPNAYYQAKSALEFPLQPYLALFDTLRQDPAVTYAHYAAASRGPVVAVAFAAVLVALARLVRRT